MRYISYEDIKTHIHGQGATISLVAQFMRISPRTLKRMFDREVDNDDLETVKDAIKEALYELELRRK